MKYAILLVFLVLGSTLATNTLLQNKLQAQAMASDAVDSALDVLKGLKQTNIDSQKLADAVNKTKEAEMKAELSDLWDICEVNKANGDAATEHRKYIEDQIDVTNQYLRWIIARRIELNQKRENLQEYRCVASMQFVKALKQHDEALRVIDMLKADVVGIVEDKTGEYYAGLSQMKDQVGKLEAYTHLFNDKAMKAFTDLQWNPAQAVDSETAQFDSRAADNSKAAIDVGVGEFNTAERDVAHRFIDMINKLNQHLIDSIADLKKNEVQAAWDLVIWLQESEKELQFLDEEQEAKTIYIDKLTISVVAAKAHEDRLWTIYFDSSIVYKDSLIKREAIRARYMAEKARRDEENLVLDGIIQLFIQQVSVLDSRSRAATTDIADDGKFNMSTGDYTDDSVDAMQGSFDKTLGTANKAARTKAY